MTPPTMAPMGVEVDGSGVDVGVGVGVVVAGPISGGVSGWEEMAVRVMELVVESSGRVISA